MLNRIKNFFKHKEYTETEESTIDKISSIFENLDCDIIRFEIGSDLIQYGTDIGCVISNFREITKDTNGFIFPAIRIISNNNLQENEINVYIQDKFISNRFLVFNKEEVTKEILNILQEIYDIHIDKIFTCKIVEKYISKAQNECAYTVWHLTCSYSIIEIRDILLQIIKNKKSIKNINYIFEKISEICFSSGFCRHYSTNIIAEKIIKQI